MANVLFVVNDINDWPIDVPNAIVMPARNYLTDPAYLNSTKLKICNLCNADRYQSLGYYISLLGEARSHDPLPRINTVEDLQSQNLVRLITEGFDELLRRTLSSLMQDSLQLNIYFGKSIEQNYDAICHQIFNLFPAPLLQAKFEKHNDRWSIYSVQALAVENIPHQDYRFITWAATDYFIGYERRMRKRSLPQYNLAILCDIDNAEAPSNEQALKKFEQAATSANINVERITHSDIGRLSEFDALFIRATTSVNHYTYRFSRYAAAKGLVVIDDPHSILRCSNKVYLAELLKKNNIPTPKTIIAHCDNLNEIISELKLPCILKQPDSAFSLGVVKIETMEQFFEKAKELLEKSELIVSQEFLPTEFDWRIGILDRKPLFACKYMMAPGHWQVIKRENMRKTHEGLTIAVPLDHVPKAVLTTALHAANLIGNGFYGVDLKQIGNKCYVIEVNDNPNVDAGNEDGILQDKLYAEIINIFVNRIEKYKERRLRSAA